jgi:hypothetical protein
MEVRLTPGDKRAIERAAGKAGMTASEYVRACTLATMALGFDPHGLRMLAREANNTLREKLKQTIAGLFGREGQ